jgi:protein phosphatase
MPIVRTAFDAAAATHVGKVRNHNEDNYLVEPDKGIWAVADGMGGHSAGEVASATIIDELKLVEQPTSSDDLLMRCEERVLNANTRLLRLAHERGIVIGSTVAILLTYEERYACVWSGDSRIYCIHNGEILQLTRDHSEAEELIAEGKLSREEARTWPGRNVITRAIGIEDNPELDVAQGDLVPGDIFVICSDGLSSHVEDSEILDSVSDRSSQTACSALIALTLERGAKDNVTVIVLRYRPSPTLPTFSGAGERDIWE